MPRRLAPLALLVLGHVAPAAAKPAAPRQVREVFMEGARHYEAGDYRDAARAFSEAYAMSNKRNLLYNIGAAYEAAREQETAAPERCRVTALAHEHYGRFLDEVWDAPNAADVHKAREQLGGELRERCHPQLTVNSSPSGATVYLDARSAKPLGKTPLVAQVKPGAHKLIVEKEGHATEVLRLELVPATPMSTSVDLKKSKGDGRARFSVSPAGATVTINGQAVGRARLAKPLILREGNYWVSVEAPDHKTWTGSLVVTRDSLAKVVVDLRSTLPVEPFPYREAAGWSGAGAAVALASAGILWGLADREYDDLSRRRDQGGALGDDDLDRGERYLLSAQVMLGAGALAGAVAGVLLALSDGDDPAEDAVEGSQSPGPAMGAAPLAGFGAGLGLSWRGTY